MSSTVTIILDGENVSLEAFVNAATRFRGLLGDLTRAYSGGLQIDWVLDDLDTSSAVLRARGLGDESAVGTVVQQYERTGRALEVGQYYDLPESARENAVALADAVGPSVERVRFETQDVDAIITLESKRALADHIPLQKSPVPSVEMIGAVEGRVQTLSSRNEFRFTLYDTLHNKAVSCYLLPEHEEIMRETWGKMALVEGVVRRDGVTGRPLTVRRVERIVALPEGRKGAWREARGIVPIDTRTLPEHTIRAHRDG